MYKKFKLPNGLSLILHPIDSVNSISVYIAVGAGPRYETKKTAGLAHFLEHMLFEGTKSLPSSRSLAEYIERVGGKSGAWTDKEYVIYWAKVPKRHLDIALNYLSDILFNSLLDKDSIEKEKSIVMEELKRSQDTPEVDVWDLWLKCIWGENQSLGRSTLGDETTIRNITKSKLQDYMNKLYHPTNMAISIVGNFSFKSAESSVIKYFGNKKNGKVPKFKKLIFTPPKIHTKNFKRNTKQTQIVLGFATDVSYHHKDRFPLRLAADILGTGVSSRIFHKLVYELGIAYSTGVQAWIFADSGLFCIYGGFSKGNVEKAIRVILQELEKLKNKKITKKELTETKEKDKAQLNFSMETPDALATLYTSEQISEKEIMTLEEMSKKIDAVSIEDIQRVARKYFIKEKLVLTIRGSLKENDIGVIENLLRI